MELNLKDFKERMIKRTETIESFSMDDIEELLSFGTGCLEESKKSKRGFLRLLVSEIAFIVSLTFLLVYNFKNARYGWLSLQFVLLIWTLYLLNRTANNFAKTKENIRDAEELIEAINLIKSKKVEQI